MSQKTNKKNLRCSQKRGGFKGGMSMLTDSMVFLDPFPYHYSNSKILQSSTSSSYHHHHCYHHHHHHHHHLHNHHHHSLLPPWCRFCWMSLGWRKHITIIIFIIIIIIIISIVFLPPSCANCVWGPLRGRSPTSLPLWWWHFYINLTSSSKGCKEYTENPVSFFKDNLF